MKITGQLQFMNNILFHTLFLDAVFIKIQNLTSKKYPEHIEYIDINISIKHIWNISYIFIYIYT
jgi:hypothetical protein